MMRNQWGVTTAAAVSLAALCWVTGPVEGRARPGTAAGQVKTANGKPVAGADIEISGYAGGRIVKKAVTNAAGKYQVSLQRRGFFTVTATKKVIFNGQPYRLEVHPTTGKHDSLYAAGGIEKNFVWKLTGRRVYGMDANNPFSYYGGHVRLGYFHRADAEAPADTARVVFTLTPVGNLADGSKGRTLTFVRTMKQLKDGNSNRPIAQSNVLHDIPLGRYKLTSQIQGTDQKMQLGSYGQSSTQVDFVFPAGIAGGGVGGYILSISDP